MLLPLLMLGRAHVILPYERMNVSQDLSHEIPIVIVMP